MTRTRREIRALGDTWNDTTLWYARGVRAMQARAPAERTSWRFLAAMHNFDQATWTALDILAPGDRLPPAREQQRYWRQCQHGSWYFLPWHRAYLLSFELIVRAAIADLGGPADWALPYWNYSYGGGADRTSVPPAFTAHRLPDGTDNPLFVARRYGRSIPADLASVEAAVITSRAYTPEDSVLPSIQGPFTPFAGPGAGHSGDAGLVESTPHNKVHDVIGGHAVDPAGNRVSGLLATTATAGLDPLFWLHHANIDRIWEVWRRRDPAANLDPDDARWLDGPADRSFAVFGADGQDLPCTARAMASLAALGYDYDDTGDPYPGRSRRGRRLDTFAARLDDLAFEPEERSMAEPSGPSGAEILGANDGAIRLGREPVTTRLRLAPRPLGALRQSFSRSALRLDTPGEPDRVFLQLDGITSRDGSGLFDIVMHPAGAPHDAGRTVGTLSLFGIEDASAPRGDHGGGGLSRTLEVTEALDAMDLHGADVAALDVRIVPRSEVPPETVRIGQVSLLRVPQR